MFTRQVMIQLGLRRYDIDYMLRNRIVPPPPKDVHGRYVWGHTDVQRVKQALEARRK